MLVKLNDQWHTVAGQPTTDGNRWTVETACGLSAEWDHVSVDSLPDGGAPHCTVAAEPAASPAPRERKHK